MGTPTGAINRRMKRIKEIADRIRRGETPSRMDIMREYGCSESIAYRTLNLAIRHIAGEPIVPQESGRQSDVRMTPKRKVYPLRLEFAGGFTWLCVSYGMMWGKPFGEITEKIDITGVPFNDGKLPLAFVQDIAQRITGKAQEKWQHLCDLTTDAVLKDFADAGIDVTGGACL